MRIRIISLLFVAALLFTADNNAAMATKGQQALLKTSFPKNQATYQSTSFTAKRPLPIFDSLYKPQSSSSVLLDVLKKPHMRWANWFSSPRIQQNRYFSSAKPSNTSPALLLQALQSGSKERLAELIKKGAVDLNTRYDNDETILHIAARDSDPDIISLLIDAGADIHAKNVRGYTPLHVAAQEGDIEAVKLLVLKGADPNATTDTRWSPGLFKHFFSFIGFSKQLSPFSGKSPLYLAQEEDEPSKKRLKIIQFLEPLTNKYLWFVVTPDISLKRAVLSNNAKMVKVLLGEHAFKKETLNREFLRAAAYAKSNPSIITMLLDSGAEIHSQTISQATALHIAAFFGNLNAVKLLLSQGVNPNALDNEGNTPLALAKQDPLPSEEMLEIIKILEPLTNQSIQKARSSIEDLRHAIKTNNAASVKQILAEFTFDKNTLNAALIEASQESSLIDAEIIEALINQGADVNTRDDVFKRTPLHHAAYYGNPEAVRVLLKRGANPNVLDYKEKSPLYLAQEEDIPSFRALRVMQLLEPVTATNLWFVETPEIMLRRAVKANDRKKIRSTLEMMEESSRYQEQNADNLANKFARDDGDDNSTKKFSRGDENELQKAWTRVFENSSVEEILGLNKPSSKTEIRAAYVNWVRNHHPDLYRDEILNKKANEILLYLNTHIK